MICLVSRHLPALALATYLLLFSACSRETRIAGSVFIVTKGGTNVKLGLVTVRAFTEKTFLEYARGYEKAVEARYETVQQKIKAAPYNGEEYKALLKELAPVQEQKRLLAQDRPSFICSSLPASLASAITDADGKFSLSVSSADDIILVAQSSREIGSEIERYHWICRVGHGGAQPKQAILSNQNLLTAESVRMIPLGIIPPA